MKKHYIVYKITNLLNSNIYIGVHKTENINDDYMGSGNLIQQAIEKYGLDNFKKEILFVFDNEKEMFKKEAELVNQEFIDRKDTYNITLGGYGGFSHMKGKFRTYDKDGNLFFITKDDPRYISGELISEIQGKVVVKDKNGNRFFVSNKDPRYLSGELVSITCGTVKVKDKSGNILTVSAEDPRYLSGELVGISKGKVAVKDKNGNKFLVDKNDKRYLSGELVHISTGTVHSEEAKRKIGKANAIKQKGANNSQFGTMWIYHPELEENQKIKKEDFSTFKKEGWVKGRKMFKKVA